MMKKLQEKREKLQAKYLKAKGFQKGFTLFEMLVVILIVLILIGIMVMSFNFFGRVDGTELVAKSKNVESATLQVALGDENRDIPALTIAGDYGTAGDKVTRVDATTGKVQALNAISEFDGADFFESETDAKVVIEAIAKKAGLSLDELYGLMRPVDEEVQKSVAGDVKVEDYVVIVKKAQLYTSDVAAYEGYNDELSGLVFSAKTIIDSEGKYYNGTSTASKTVTTP